MVTSFEACHPLAPPQSFLSMPMHVTRMIVRASLAVEWRWHISDFSQIQNSKKPRHRAMHTGQFLTEPIEVVNYQKSTPGRQILTAWTCQLASVSQRLTIENVGGRQQVGSWRVSHLSVAEQPGARRLLLPFFQLHSSQSLPQVAHPKTAPNRSPNKGSDLEFSPQ